MVFYVPYLYAVQIHFSTRELTKLLLMADQETYDSIINWNRALLAIIGLWPNESNEYSVSSTIRFIVSTFLIFYAGTAPQTAELFIVCRDIDSVMENLTNSNFAMTNSLVKILVWWRSKTDLEPIINCIREDWKKLKTDMEYKEMWSVAKLGRSMTQFLFVMAQGNVLICCSLNVFMHLTGIFSTRFLYFPRSYYPYNTSMTPIYEITWFSQFIGGITAATTYIAVDGFIGFLVLHICGQMAILKNELTYLTEPMTKERKNSLGLIRDKLRCITRRHAYLISLVEIIENDFNMMFLFQVLSLSIQICFQGYQGLKALASEEGASFFQVFFMCYFTFCVVLLFYVYCYVDEQLIVQTSGIRIAAYECEWHKLPVDEVKALAFIVLRAEKPPCITAGKFCSFTMVTFGEVLKRSVGYLSVLITIREF